MWKFHPQVAHMALHANNKKLTSKPKNNQERQTTLDNLSCEACMKKAVQKRQLELGGLQCAGAPPEVVTCVILSAPYE